MFTLDSALNVIIPVAVLLFVGFTFYKGLNEPIDQLIAWIKKQINNKKAQHQEQPEEETYGSILTYK